jgi:hypothetical protein
MLEAFQIRLSKLFPESRVTLGKRIQSVGLKPDIFIEHPDGHKWAYEMIYGNKSAEKVVRPFWCRRFMGSWANEEITQ